MAQHILIVPGVLPADDPGILDCRPISLQRVLQIIHLFHGADHGGQVIIRQHLERLIQYLLHFGGTKIFGQLGRAYQDEKLDQLVILPDVPKAEDLRVDHLFIFCWAFCPAVRVSDEIPQFLLAER